MENHPTASIIIIGEEVLNGQARDTNSSFLCQQLVECGVQVEKVSVVPDYVDAIAEEVALLSNKCTYVLTSGGIGTTHDVTYAGVAKAFGEKVVENKELVDIFCKFGFDQNIALRLSLVPQSSRVYHIQTIHDEVFVPIVSIRNVFMFPSSPSYLKCTFMHLKQLFSRDALFLHRIIYLRKTELNIAAVLKRAIEQCGSCVTFESYYFVNNAIYEVKLTLEAESESDLDKAEAYLRSILPGNSIVNPLNLQSDIIVKELYDLTQTNSMIKEQLLSTSIDTIEHSLKEYGPEKMCLSFNGGKDCTALLHLTSCVFRRNNIRTKLKILYVHGDASFPEMDEFIELCVQRYDLEVITYDYPIIDALQKLKVDHPEIFCILIGTRQTDPCGGQMKIFQLTDSNWPQFMRVSPLLHWGYNDVWKFIRVLNIPYCSLYDQGYTSLGCKNSTIQNPTLKMMTEKGEEFYGPAFLLKEPSEERGGRAS